MRPENPIGEPFEQLFEVESSNNYAMRQVKAHLAGHGATWFVHNQTAGKGQRNKGWVSNAGENILISIVMEPYSMNIENKFCVSAAIAIACYDFFSSYALDETKIKWTNDIYWRDRKAGGILIENIIEGNKWRYSIVGIGLNINQTSFPSDIINPVSLKQITGKTFDCVEMAKQLCTFINARWQQLVACKEDEIIDAYNKNLYKLNKHVTFKKDDAEFTALVTGVNNNGDILINTGSQIALPYGEWQWVID